MGDDDLVRRAFAAWYRSENIHTQPANTSGIRKHAKKRYVVLNSIGSATGILAVYRVKNDGFLKRLKRWPKELEE